MENRYKLVEVITKHIIAEDWLDAKNEWEKVYFQPVFCEILC